MKSKWTLALTISTITIVFLSFLFVVLNFAGYDQINRIVDSMPGWSNNRKEVYDLGSHESIPLIIFSAISVIIAGAVLVFYVRMDSTLYKKWFYAAVVTSLAIAFSVSTVMLNNDIKNYQMLDTAKNEPIPTTKDDPSFTLEIISKIRHLRSLMIMLGNVFAFKAFMSATSGLALIGAIIITLREIGYSLETGEASKANTTIASSSGRKLDKSLDLVTKAKVLCDNGAITSKEFKEIKERELSINA